MKNKYSPVSDSDESFKTLIDEKSDIHSSEGTPPPYSAPNKFIDLEMADGSAQHSAQESTNNAGSDSIYSKWIIIIYLFFFASLGYIGAYCILLVMFFYFKVPVRAQDFWGLFGGFIGAISLFLYLAHMLYPGWYKQAGRVLSYLFTQTGRMLSYLFTQTGRMLSYLFTKICSVLPNMCVAVICTASLNVVGFVVYHNVKKIIGFEKMNDIAFYGVCIVNVAVFVLFWSTTDTRQLRIFIAGLGNGMGSIGNGMGNSIRNAANYVRPTDPENEAPHNEEIELQPFAGQSAEV
ncbi:uncharacterized protein SOCG_03093 [Schizosaccharomyces octosporus yFS286]|uniref:Uncharacterized protein n=1 Tax=Schizosaccharomyces octosporus (strain yFS286) TaxID=483514 RepID=S9RIP1_SCHOY|nr:uncharacterized protein SOCG_03093 [Schizosaccharomyces octosporus yFS286]EPX73874.1 hypothetical protein SOCG_03093 [Schizosaccharomyces octosporus yFS286]